MTKLGHEEQVRLYRHGRLYVLWAEGTEQDMRIAAESLWADGFTTRILEHNGTWRLYRSATQGRRVV